VRKQSASVGKRELARTCFGHSLVRHRARIAFMES
jgi:hypothetical protein